MFAACAVILITHTWSWNCHILGPRIPICSTESVCLWVSRLWSFCHAVAVHMAHYSHYYYLYIISFRFLSFPFPVNCDIDCVSETISFSVDERCHPQITLNTFKNTASSNDRVPPSKMKWWCICCSCCRVCLVLRLCVCVCAVRHNNNMLGGQCERMAGWMDGWMYLQTFVCSM